MPRTTCFSTPLTIEAVVNGNITIDNKANGDIFYRIDSGDENIVASNSKQTINLSSGQKIQFWGNNPRYYIKDYTNLKIKSQCYVYGNIMSCCLRIILLR